MVPYYILYRYTYRKVLRQKIFEHQNLKRSRRAHNNASGSNCVLFLMFAFKWFKSRYCWEYIYSAHMKNKYNKQKCVRAYICYAPPSKTQLWTYEHNKMWNVNLLALFAPAAEEEKKKRWGENLTRIVLYNYHICMYVIGSGYLLTQKLRIRRICDTTKKSNWKTLVTKVCV